MVSLHPNKSTTTTTTTTTMSSYRIATMAETGSHPISDPPQNKHIFILAGQSNMSGQGGVTHNRWDGNVPAACKPHPSIIRLNARLQWEPAREPLHIDIDTRAVVGVGPGMSFANAVREKVGTVALVPCAIGGTAIKEWARGEKLYENMVKRAKESMKGGGEIKALLWYQGESDTFMKEDADAYQRNMEMFVANVRQDLCLPSLPIIQVALASGFIYINKVRKAQLGMKLHNVICVDAKGLTLQRDNLHLTTYSQARLGQMLANAYINNFPPSPNHSLPSLRNQF